MGAKISKSSSFNGKLKWFELNDQITLCQKFATVKLIQSPDKSSKTKNKLSRKKVMRRASPDQRKNWKVRDLMTLEDHLRKSSPGSSSTSIQDSISDGELCVFKRPSKKVPPSSRRAARKKASMSFEGRPSFSLETLVILDREADQYFSSIPTSIDVPSVSRRQSSIRQSKRVRFKPVEKGDIHMFQSPNDPSENHF